MTNNPAFIHGLFPTPVFSKNINRKFTKKEMQLVNLAKKETNKNDGNITSKNNYILNKPEFKEVNKFINDCLDEYLKKVISPINDLKLYVTQSWLNWTNEGEFHHVHSHANSVVSGVLYIDSDNENDRIKFINPSTYQQLKPAVKDFNIFNSDTWWLAVETGQIVMFPSSFVHQVDCKKGTNTRISLAFNTFYKGKLGINSNLTELIL
jgi:uncharacterized protein (TIGR02466 family)